MCLRAVGSGEESEPCISKSNHVGGIGRVLAAGGGHKRKKKRMQKGEKEGRECVLGICKAIHILTSCQQQGRTRRTCKARKQEKYSAAT